MAKHQGRPVRKVYSDEEHNHAGEDAKRLLMTCKPIEVCFSTMVLALHLYHLTRGLIQHEIKEGWEIVHPDLVMERLTGKAHEISLRPTPLVELQQGVLTTVTGLLDILIQQQLEAPPEEQPAAETPQETAHVD